MQVRLSFPVVAAAALVLMLPLAGTAAADPVPPEQRLFVIGWSEGAQIGDTMNVFGLDLSDAPPGTTITGAMTSCGRPVADGVGGVYEGHGFASFTLLDLGDLGGPDNTRYLPTQYPSDDDRTVEGVSPRLVGGDLVGPSYDYSLTVTQPGFDPYVLTGSQSVHVVKRPSCDTINTTVQRTIRVLSWSTLLGKPKVGKTVSATRPVIEGDSKVRFKWVVGKTVLGRHAKLRLSGNLRHKYVQLVVRISQPGKTVQREYLAFPHGIK